MNTMWNKLKKGISDGYRTISDKTEEMTRIGRLKLEIIALKRDIEKAFIELGGRVYHAFDTKSQDNINSKPDVKKLVKDIKSLEKRLKSLEVKVDLVRNPDPEEQKDNK